MSCPSGIRLAVRSSFCEGLEAADDFLSRGGGAADDEDRVLAADGADDFGPLFRVERFADRLGAAAERVEHDELTDAVDVGEEVWQQGVEARRFVFGRRG